LQTETGEGHSLGTHLEGQNLDGIEGLQRGDTNGKHCVEDEDESDKGLTGGGRVSLVVDADGNDGGNPDEGNTDHGEQQQRATSDLVDKSGTEDGKRELHAGKTKVDVHLLRLIVDSSRLEHGGDEVRDGAYRKLASKT
jgi:hypothetical protein